MLAWMFLRHSLRVKWMIYLDLVSWLQRRLFGELGTVKMMNDKHEKKVFVSHITVTVLGCLSRILGWFQAIHFESFLTPQVCNSPGIQSGIHSRSLWSCSAARRTSWCWAEWSLHWSWSGWRRAEVGAELDPGRSQWSRPHPSGFLDPGYWAPTASWWAAAERPWGYLSPSERLCPPRPGTGSQGWPWTGPGWWPAGVGTAAGHCCCSWWSFPEVAQKCLAWCPERRSARTRRRRRSSQTPGKRANPCLDCSVP